MKARKELKEFRTPNSKRFLNKDGTIQVELYKEPIHYKSDDGQYEEIDNTFEETTTGVKNKRNDFIVEFDEKNENCLLNISSKGHKLCMYPKKIKGKQRDKKSTKGIKKRRIDRVKYEGILDNTDIEYELHSKCLKESIILHEKPKNNIIEFILKTDLDLSVDTDNSIYISYEKEKLFKLEKPFMIDNKKSYSESIKYEIEKNQNEYEIRMVLDKEWMNSKDREYPIIIDPTITGIEESNSVIDTYIFSGDEDVTTYNQNKLLVGTNQNNIAYRSLLKFNLPVIPTGYRMMNARLSLYSIPEYGTNALIDKKICVHKINKQWDVSTAKWSNMNDAYDNKIYDYSLSSKSLYYAENDEIKIEWGGTGANVTELVQEWYTNPDENFGLMLKWHEEAFASDNEICEFVSSEYLADAAVNSIKPMLSITYKDFNGLENYLSYSTQTHHFGAANINNYTGNLTVDFNVGNTIGGNLPIAFSLVYNTNDVIANKDYGYGLGVKPNLIQTLEEEQISVISDEDESIVIYDMLKYLDEDGTIHYFYKHEDGIYYDEDGLGLTIVGEENNYLMTDSNGNTNKFVLHGDIYYLEEIKNANNKTIQINYDINNRIISAVDSTNQSVVITYAENLITISSPHLESTINLTNNLITSITSLGDTENITYTENNLIEKITNPNGLAIKYEYLNTLTSKISKVMELSRNNNIGNYLTFEYNLADTKITDNKGIFSTYIFNSYGNVIGVTRLDNENNLKKAYGKSYSFGDEESNQNKLTADKSLIQYVNNLINDSSFEGDEISTFVNGDINSTNVKSTAHSKSGLKSLSVDLSENSGYIYKEFNVDKGKTYTFSGFIKGISLINDTEQVSFDLILSYDGKQETTKITELTNEFTRYSVTIDYDEEAIENLKLTIQNDNAETVCFFLDDIQLEEGEVANYYNLISNSNFENGTIDWNIEISAEMEDEEVSGAEASVVAIDNTNALKIHSNPSDCIYISKLFNITGKAGDTFNLSFWYKNESIIPSGYVGLNAGIWTNVFFHYGDDYLDGAGIPAEVLNVGSDNWQFLSKNFTAEADYENITLQILSASNANDCYFTNFTLFKDLEAYSYVYDENGNLISVVDLSKQNNILSYNSNNQLQEIVNSSNNNYVFEYDKLVKNQLIKINTPTGVTGTIKYDSNANPTKIIINNKGILSEIEYDKKYYLRAKGTNKFFNINTDKTISVKENECSYDKFYIILCDNNLVKIKHAVLNNYYIKEIGEGILLSYGDTENKFELIRNDDSSYSIKSVISNKVMCIDEGFNIVLTNYEDSANNQDFFFEDAENKKYIENVVEYTEDGRFITKKIDELGNSTIYTINNMNSLVESIVNANNIITTIQYDDKMRVKNIEKNNKSVSYAYDTNNNISNILHGNKNYTFNYDEFNNCSNVNINNINLINYDYNENNGNIKEITYGNNQNILYDYDNFNRTTKVTKGNDIYNYKYDNLGRISQLMSSNNRNKFSYDFAKRLSTYSHNDYETTYEYNINNKVIKKKEKLNNFKYLYNYEYNENSMLTKLINNDNEFKFIYDELGRMELLKINDIYSIKYNYLTYGNKTSNIINEIEENGNKTKYVYDKLGNIEEIYRNNILTNKYYYDNNSQLIKEENFSSNRIMEYLYDDVGNILKKKVYSYNILIEEKNYSYERSDWQDLLTKYNDENITYDNIGNPIKIGENSLTWTNGKELTSFTDATNSINYFYNLDGIRTSKKVNGVETKYYLENTSIIYENRNGSMIYYLYKADELLGFVYDNNTYFYHKNLLGDIIGILDSNYNEIVTYEYDSWGKIVSITDDSNNNISLINPFRYRSYYYDEETKLYYLNSRYYNPEWGRFINTDSVICGNDDVNSYNLFVYTSNNPINYKDTRGYGIFKSISKAIKSVIKKVIKKVQSISKTNSTSNKTIATDKITKQNVELLASSSNSDLPRFSDPFDHKWSRNGNKERWYGPDGKAFKDRHYTDHGNPRQHPVVPHDHTWGYQEDGNWKPGDWEVPHDDDIPVQPEVETEEITNTIIGVTAAYGIYLIIKWGIAAAAAPATGGGSLAIAGATP